MPDITVGRLQGGFCVYWADPTTAKRRRFRLEARSIKEAEAEALELYRHETFKSQPSDPTISKLWAGYIDDLGAKPTAKTMRYTGKAVLAHFGSHTAATIDRKSCVAYQKLRLKNGVSIGTIHTELGHLQSTLNWAEKTRQISIHIHVWRPSKPEHDFRILDRSEISLLINSAIDPHMRLALILLFGTGARIGALLDLQWDRVHFDTNEINLRLSDSITRKGRARVPMNSMVRQALSEAQPGAISDYVLEYAGGPIKSIKKGFVSAVGRSGIGHFRIHDARHTAAVTMLTQGVPLTKVSQMLGHSNTSVTQRVYARYLPNHMQDAADVLDFSQP